MGVFGEPSSDLGISNEVIAGGQGDSLTGEFHGRTEMQSGEFMQRSIIEIVLGDRGYLVDPADPIAQGPGRPKIDHQAGRLGTQSRAEGHCRIHLPCTRDQDGQFMHVQVSCLLLEGHHEQRQIRTDGSVQAHMRHASAIHYR